MHQWYRRSPEEYAGFLVILLVFVLLYLFFKKFPVTGRARGWLGLAFMALTLSGVTSLYGPTFNSNLFWWAALVIPLLIWVQITWKAKTTIMEIWMAVAMGMPLAQYVVRVLKSW